MSARSGALPVAFVAAAALALGGCAATSASLGRRAGLPSRAEVGGLKAFVQQEKACGPAALATLLDWAGRPEPPEVLLPLVYLPGRSGTLSIDLFREVRARGLLAYRLRPDAGAVLRETAAGHPVLVLENRGLSFAPLWHYSVVGGYDLEEGTVTLYAGAASPERVRVGAFRRSWKRGGSVGLLALPSGELPAAEDPEGILAALAELEEAGRGEAAVGGYRAFLARWPGSWRAAFGLGNALHAIGDDVAAEAAIRTARAAAPDRPEPLNNLALLALGRGERPEAESLALAAVEKARALGLPEGLYEETLAEVRGKGVASER